VDCFDISLTEQSEGERIPLGRPKKIAHFCVVSFLFLHQEGFEPEMGERNETLRFSFETCHSYKILR